MCPHYLVFTCTWDCSWSRPGLERIEVDRPVGCGRRSASPTVMATPQLGPKLQKAENSKEKDNGLRKCRYSGTSRTHRMEFFAPFLPNLTRLKPSWIALGLPSVQCLDADAPPCPVHHADTMHRVYLWERGNNKSAGDKWFSQSRKKISTAGLATPTLSPTAWDQLLLGGA